MKIVNKKGFGLIMAVTIITVLLIMAAGFFQLTDYSRKSVSSNIENLRMYWAAESSSNYNVNYWINLPDTVRKVWPSIYITPSSKGSVYYDTDGKTTDATKFDGAAGTAVGDKMFLHPSSLFEGNAGDSNDELEDFKGLKLINVRYKGSRIDEPDQAVWILDSYAWDPKTGAMSNIVLSNVYNYISMHDGEFENSELINTTLLGLTGFHGVKGRFNEQDIRYGKCYFADIVHFDYTTGAQKYGPTFYGLVQSASEDVSVAKTDPFTDLSRAYSFGLYLNAADIKSQADAEKYAAMSLKGGYEKLVDAEDLDDVVWTWDDIVKYGPENGLYNLDSEGKFTAGDVIKVLLKTTEPSVNYKVTTCEIYRNGKLAKTLPIGKAAGEFTGVAVPEKYGTTSISGVSAKDFSLITQKDQVQVTDDFYLYEMAGVKKELEAMSDVTTVKPAESILKWLWDSMETIKPEGHLAVIAAIDVKAADYVKGWAPIYLPNETLIFSNASYLTNCGELSAKGTGQTNLRMYNIGAVMVLDQQEIMSGPADTAQKWPKIFIQDQRYLDPNEPLPPFCGESPSAHPGEKLQGLNPKHTWSRGVSGTKTDNWEKVVWRNL